MAKKKQKKAKQSKQQSKTRKCSCCQEMKQLSDFPRTPKLDELLHKATEIFNKRISENMCHEKVVDLTFETAMDILDDVTAANLAEYAVEDNDILTESWAGEDILFENEVCAAAVMHHTLIGKVAFNLHEVYMETHEEARCTCNFKK